MLYSPEFLEKIEELKNKINLKRVENSNKITPDDRVGTKGQFKYVNEDYMRAELDRQFIWSYIPIKAETIYMEASFNGNTIKIPFAEKTLGRLEIVDEGIKRSFPAPGYQLHKYTGTKGWETLNQPEIVERGAWSRGLSFAINRLTRIADDVVEKKATEYKLKKELLGKITELKNYYIEKTPKPHGFMYQGIATK